MCGNTGRRLWLAGTHEENWRRARDVQGAPWEAGNAVGQVVGSADCPDRRSVVRCESREHPDVVGGGLQAPGPRVWFKVKGGEYDVPGLGTTTQPDLVDGVQVLRLYRAIASAQDTADRTCHSPPFQCTDGREDAGQRVRRERRPQVDPAAVQTGRDLDENDDDYAT